MKLSRIARVAAAAVLLLAAGCKTSNRTPSSPSWQQRADVPSMRDTVIYLASDAQGGRGVGTPGIDRAGKYIADRFKLLGLQPVKGLDGYYQPFEMTVGASIDPATTLSAAGRTWTLGSDYTPVNFSSAKAFSGPVVFAGYGISSEKYHYDDYAGIDARGKVVLELRYEPHTATGKSRFTGAEWSEEASLDHKARTAAEHGAVGVLFVTPPTFHGQDDRLMTFGHQVSGRVTPVPIVQVTRELAGAILSSAGAPSLAELQKEIDDSGRPHSRELARATASGDIQIKHDQRAVRNVVAELPGTGAHADEYVVVGAHYDHLGRGGLVPGSRAGNAIYHGADDNASGTAVVLEIARRIAEQGPRERSIIFMAFTGEEEGLIGSAYFLNHCPVPVESIAYMLNLDMVGRLRDETLLVGGQGTAVTLKPILDDADKGSELKLKNIGEGGLGPSDHMSFALKKIPVLFFFTGLHPDYHRPTDTWDKINYGGMEQVAEFGVKVVDDLAAAPREPYISAADAHSMSIGTPSARVTLGVIPDYSEDQSRGGVPISGTTPGSPAAAAGLQAGDVIVQVGDKKIDNLYDLTDFLAAAEPNQVVTVTVMRDKKPVKLSATLKERKGQ